jgi:SsrA-binding protein
MSLMPKIYAKNRKASFDYEILSRYEAGLVLQGSEVKSIQNGQINLAGALVSLKTGRPMLLNAEISPYQVNNTPLGYNPTRDRQILLNKRELAKISNEIESKKLTIIPLSVYNKKNLIKLEIGLARKRKKSDKREAIKKKETRRKIKSVVK